MKTLIECDWLSVTVMAWLIGPLIRLIGPLIRLIGPLIRYIPNARTNVLKLKSEFIPGLADTVRKRLWMMAPIAC